jgi:RND family efflux transporter MFP subunit
MSSSTSRIPIAEMETVKMGRLPRPEEDRPPSGRGPLKIVLLGIAVTALLVCGGAVRVGWNAVDGWLHPPEPVVRPVRAMVVQSGGGAFDKTFTGVTRAGEEAQLSFKVAGSVSRVVVQVGSTVRAGDVIAELDSVDYQLQLQQLQASVASANARYKSAQLAYDRARELYASNDASKADLDNARASADAARAALSAASQQRKLASQQVSYATLRATRDASVADIFVNEGENVAVGQPVVLLASSSRPEVILGVPGSLIRRVEAGMPAEILVPAAQSTPFAGTITEVGVKSSSATTFPATVRFDEETEEVLPGMAAEVQLSFPALADQSHIRVPPWAVAEDREGRFVYVVRSDDGEGGTIERRAVTLGELTTEGLEIVEGLQEGDTVVTAGISRIEPQQQVLLQLVEP